MSKLRIIEISNFRAIHHFKWYPSEGINCLIGHGDSGKTTILDAIDWCLGARRNLPVTDADFNCLNVENSINIQITIGDLDYNLKNIDSYGIYLRGFNQLTKEILPEPEMGQETVLTVQLLIEKDLEPQWTLVSERAYEQNLSRNLSWSDRTNIAPNRLGSHGEYNLSWRKNSILYKVSEENVDISSALAESSREARSAFGNIANDQLTNSLDKVKVIADKLGINVGNEVKALLDSLSVY